MPRKPQPLSGRAARCAPRRLTRCARSSARCLRRSLRLARASLSRRLRRRAPRSSAAPFSPAPEWWSSVARGGWRPRRGCSGARATRAREAGARRCCAVPARSGRGWGGLRYCGCCAVAELLPSRLLSWRTERATAGLVNAVNEGQKVTARQPATAGSPDRLSRRRAADMSLREKSKISRSPKISDFRGRRPRAAEGLLAVAVQCSSVCTRSPDLYARTDGGVPRSTVEKTNRRRNPRLSR